MENPSNKETVNQIMSHLIGAATAAADSVTDAVQTAGQVVGEKYDELIVTLELARLRDEQTRVFAKIGRTLYLLKNGSFHSAESHSAGDSHPEAVADSEKPSFFNPQKAVDILLLEADQLQQDIDILIRKTAKIKGAYSCSNCGKLCSNKSSFCSSCGNPISK